MFTKKHKQKLDARVRYQQPRFKKRLAEARRFRRPVLLGFWGRVRSLVHIVRRRLWLLIGGAALVGLLYAAIFVPELFFIRTVTVTGASGQVQREVKEGVEQYLSGRVLFVFPRRNMWLVSTKGIASHITTTNSHVWQVTEVRRQPFHGLALTVVPRQAEFMYRMHESEYILANDGTVLPESEPRPDGLLAVSGELAHNPVVGERYVSGDVLTSLMAAKEFPVLTGLPALAGVEFVPVTVLSARTEPDPAEGAAHTSSGGSVSSPQVRQEILDVPPTELRLKVPASDGISSFSVFVRTDGRVTEALQKLRLLLTAQPKDRLPKLVYVDMRLQEKAFVCLAGSPCANVRMGESGSGR